MTNRIDIVLKQYYQSIYDKLKTKILMDAELDPIEYKLNEDENCIVLNVDKYKFICLTKENIEELYKTLK